MLHRVSRWSRFCAATTLLALLVNSATLDAGEADFFEQKIRPVLIKHCYACHSAEAAEQNKLKAGLALDTRAGWSTGGESGAAVVPGQPDKSLLLQALRHADDAPAMPPDEQLSAAIIADFEQWIRDGAFDPRQGKAVAVKKGLSLDEGRKFWSLVPPESPRVPEVRQRDWPADDIDRFVLAKLEAHNLRPTVDARPEELIRRVYFDLIGLPPQPEAVEAFVRACQAEEPKRKVESGKPDPNPSALSFQLSAFSARVDELLESRHFGERWGRHWLDSARFAESNGRDRNVFFYHAWRYRDWVIAAFNRDQPYDAFVRDQIAGDLLGGADRAERDARLVATGFLALGAKAFEEQKPDVFRMDVVDEQIELIGRTVLGLSVGCARCHDHKFDPIPTADYYALAGILRSTETLHGYGPTGIKATSHSHSTWHALGADAEALAPAGREYHARLHELTLKRNTARSDRYRIVRRVADAKQQLLKEGADQAKLTQDIARLEQEVKDWDLKIKEHDRVLNEALDQPPPQPAWAMGARDRTAVEDCRIHVRGDTLNLGDSVPRGVLHVIALPQEKIDHTSSGRLQLAAWLTDRRNPLTARVWVNRVWQHLLGRGLVTTPDDFGVNGARPSHGELLDHLASRWMNDGWSTKRLIRAIVLSRAYRQAVQGDSAQLTAANMQADPDNVYLWHFKPRRLEAEALRDAIMSVSGQLDVSPPEQPFLSRLHPHREEENRTFQPVFTPDKLEHAQRSVYLPVVRGVLNETFQLFDFAAPDRPVAQRDESTVPAQSLFMMNNAWVIEQARHAATRVLQDAALDDAGRIDRLYRLAFARAPTLAEVDVAQRYLSKPETLQVDPKSKTAPSSDVLRLARWASFCQAIFASAEFRYLK